jgi:HK97 family phage major capsid protein
MNKKEYLAKRASLLEEAQRILNEGKMEEYDVKEKEIKDLDESFEKFAKAQANMNALKDQSVVMEVVNESNIKIESVKTEEADVYASLEYRKAFMNYCKTGNMSKEFKNQDAYTDTTEAAAVIPTPIMDEIIKKMTSYGQIFNAVRKANIKGGVKVPILSLKPTASWITQATPSDRKKVTANTSVTFSYYGLECKVATSLIETVVTLPSFESTIVSLIVEAMTKALDIAVIKGDGDGEPLGITVDSRIPVANIITLSSSEISDWGAWKKKVFAKIALAYRAGGSFIMAAGTFDGYIDAMQDANGQPIGRVNYGITEGPQERFGGKPVILVEDDVVTPYDSAANGDIIAVFCKLSDYVINSNMQMTMYRWLDHDLNQYVDKAILVADGKILDPEGVVIIKKGA